MPVDTTPAKGTRTSRNSIRHSLNLASVGKALADVMNKDGKDGESRRSATKAKETQSKRLSSMGLSKVSERSTPVSALSKPSPRNITSPDLKTVTRSTRTFSSTSKANGSSLDELGVKATEASTPQSSVTLTRATSVLRPRSVAAGSALPKYRPKSVAADNLPTKPPSPVRAGTRRKHASSEEERDVKGRNGTPSGSTLNIDSPVEKASRPISPIPRRSSTRFTLPNAANGSPLSQASKEKGPNRSLAVSSTPQRPTKTAKSSSSPSAKASSSLRPPSASSPPQRTTRTARTPTSSGAASARTKGPPVPSPLRGSVHNSSPSPSPLGRSFKKVEKATSERLKSSSTEIPVISQSSSTADSSADSIEADDVEFMLSAIASPTAPTPALPRIRTMAYSHLPPQTPSRQSNHLLPSRANLSYLSPSPRLQTDGSPSAEQTRRLGNDRGSLLSWDQLAADTSNVLGDAELGNMLSEISAPFLTTPGLASPSPSMMRLDESDPASPSPHQLPSPGGFTSISQILLPNVTPSPAVHYGYEYGNGGPEIPAIDAAVVTLLRLQLASAENLAKERLNQIQSLENQVYTMKESRAKEEEELAFQVSQLEEQMRESLASRDRTNDSHLVHQLEDQLKQAHDFRERSLNEAVSRIKEEDIALQDKLLREAQRKRQLSCAVRDASEQWGDVRDIADGELELIKSNRDTLVVLLADLASCQFQLSI